MKPFIKHFSKTQIISFQRDLEDSDYKDHLMTIYTPQEIEEIKNWKYVSTSIKIRNSKLNIYFKNKKVVNLIISFIGIMILIFIITNFFDGPNQLRESDIMEKKLFK
jgi:hypothetical protein